MTKIELIKNTVTIRDLAERFNARPDKSGKCKHNPLRSEKTSSLHIYDETNSWFDFGSDKGGDVINFMAEANGSDIPDSISDLCNMYSINSDESYIMPVMKEPIVVKKETWSSSIVLKNFNTFKDISLKEHRDILLGIAPEYLFHQAKEKDFCRCPKGRQHMVEPTEASQVKQPCARICQGCYYERTS